MYREQKTAARLPRLAELDSIPEDEIAAYERAVAKVRKYSMDNVVARARPLVDGEPYALPYHRAMTNAPATTTALSDTGMTVLAHEGLPGHLRGVDHEITYFVLGFDSGYWAFHAGHTPNAITAGVRIEALEALADGREDDLTDDERQQLEFIRAVRDGTMNDDIWMRMAARLGSERGAIEFAAIVVFLFSTHRLMWAVGAPATTEDEWRDMVRSFKDGTRDAAAATQVHVWQVLERAKETRREPRQIPR